MSDAISLGGIKTKFTADIADFSLKMNTLKSQMRDVSSESQRMGTEFGEGFSMPNIAKTLMGIGTALGAVVAASIRSAFEDNESTAIIGARANLSRKEAEKLGSFVRELKREGLADLSDDTANNIAISAQQMLKGTNAGVEDTAKAVAKLKRIFPELDVETTMGAVNNMVRNFGITGTEAVETLYDTMSKTGQVQEVAEQFKEYSVHFDQLGYSAGEMANRYVHGVETGVYMLDYIGDMYKEFNINFAELTNDQIEAVQALGLDPDQIAQGFMKGGADRKKVFEDIMMQIQKVDNKLMKQRIVSKLFGSKGEDISLKYFEEYNKVVEKGIDSTNDLNKSWKQFRDNSGSQAIKELKGAFWGLGVVIGKELLPAFIYIVRALTDMVNWLTKFLEKHPMLAKFIAWTLFITAALSMLIGVLIMVVFWWKMIAVAAALVSPKIGAALIAGLSGVGTVLMFLLRATVVGFVIWAIYKIIEYTIKANGGFKEAISNLVFMLTFPFQLFMLLFKLLAKMWHVLADSAKSFGRSVASVFVQIGRIIMKPFELLGDGFRWLFGKLNSVYDFFSTTIPKILADLWNDAGENVDKILGKIKNGLGTFGDWILPDIGGMASDSASKNSKFNSSKNETSNTTINVNASSLKPENANSTGQKLAAGYNQARKASRG